MKKTIQLIICLLVTQLSFSQVTFSVTSTGTNPQIDSAVQYTTDIWAAHLNSSVPIKIKFIYSDLTAAGPLGITFPNGRKDFSLAPESNLWYASCLANSIAGVEINTGEFDMDIYMNSSTNYYFGLDGNPGPGQYDFVSVFLHEICHGLGALTVSEINTGIGSYGYLTAASTFPLVTSFPFPVLEGFPTIWDFHMVNGAGDRITDTLLFANQSSALGDEFESNDLYFAGANAAAANFGNDPKIFAPTSYDDGSSLHHFDESTFPSASGNGLMTPYISNQEVNHIPGSILIGALQDIGWSTNVVGLDESTILSKTLVYPNPTSDNISVSWNDEILVEFLSITDLTGKVVLEMDDLFSNSILINTSDLKAGNYIIFLISSTETQRIKFVKQ